MFLIKLQACIVSVNIVKFSKTAFFIKHLLWLLPKSPWISQKGISSGGVIDYLFILNGIKVWVFFGKKIEKKHLRHHDKNYYNFCKSNVRIINLIVGSRNMIKFQKMWVCVKLDKQRESFLPNTDNFLVFFIVFERCRILESAMDQ